jgi:hypothetical protein
MGPCASGEPQGPSGQPGGPWGPVMERGTGPDGTLRGALMREGREVSECLRGIPLWDPKGASRGPKVLGYGAAED